MAEEQKSAGWAFWCVATLLVGPLIYVLSLGPLCWLSSRVGGEKVVSVAYRPLTFTAEVIDSDALMEAIQWYSNLGAAGVWTWTFRDTRPGIVEWCQLEFDVDFSMGPVFPPSGSGPSAR